MTKYISYRGHRDISELLKGFIANEPAKERYIDQSECYFLIRLIGRLQAEADAFIITTDPHENYCLSLENLATVVRIISSMISQPSDLRIFGISWAVSLSSYASSDQDEQADILSLDQFEMKISLIGEASSWLDS